MSQEFTMQPRLLIGAEDAANFNDERRARVARLISIQNAISRHPETYLRAFTEMGEEATSETLDLHDEKMATSDAVRDPKQRIKEYFTKRDDREIDLDEESSDAIYGDPEFKRLSGISQKRISSSVRTGVMKSEKRPDPEAQRARDEVRRYLFGQYLGRAVLWKEQQHQQEKRRPTAS